MDIEYSRGVTSDTFSETPALSQKTSLLSTEELLYVGVLIMLVVTVVLFVTVKRVERHKLKRRKYATGLGWGVRQVVIDRPLEPEQQFLMTPSDESFSDSHPVKTPVSRKSGAAFCGKNTYDRNGNSSAASGGVVDPLSQHSHHFLTPGTSGTFSGTNIVLGQYFIKPHHASGPRRSPQTGSPASFHAPGFDGRSSEL